MNQPAKRLSPLDKQWWTSARVLCIGLLLLVAGYIYAQPTLERWLGMELPSLVDQAANPGDRAGDADPDPAADRDESSSYPLEKIARDTWRTPEGLVYGMGPGGQTRLEHVARHTVDDLSRPVHGVFDVRGDELLRLLDEAWVLVKQDSPDVRRKQDDDRTELTITMPQEIGFVGGANGQRENRPRTRRIKLILEGDRVITAYPTWPRR